MTTTPTTVGQFTWDGESISGPAAFMQSAEYRRCIDSIQAGTNHTFRMAYEYQMEQPAPDFGIALLVTVQTVYAGWHGMETFNRRRGA